MYMLSFSNAIVKNNFCRLIVIRMASISFFSNGQMITLIAFLMPFEDFNCEERVSKMDLNWSSGPFGTESNLIVSFHSVASALSLRRNRMYCVLEISLSSFCHSLLVFLMSQR